MAEYTAIVDCLKLEPGDELANEGCDLIGNDIDIPIVLVSIAPEDRFSLQLFPRFIHFVESMKFTFGFREPLEEHAHKPMFFV